MKFEGCPPVTVLPSLAPMSTAAKAGPGLAGGCRCGLVQSFFAFLLVGL
jgi:hypothetical protein